MLRIGPGLSLAARKNAFATGHHHLNVTDLAAHKRFWGELLGGELARFGETDVVKLPDTLLFLRAQEPAGGSSGSTVDHLGFSVPDLQGLVRRMKAAGVEMVTAQVVAGCEGDIHRSPDQDIHLAFALGPDGMRVELMEDKALGGTVIHHVHI